MRLRSKTPLWKDALTGAVAGLVGTVAMTQFQNALSAISKRNKNGQDQPQGDAPATVRTVEAMSEKLGRRDLDEKRKKSAGMAVHYLFGTANGALYGAVSPRVPKARLGFGSLFGTALWAVADELAVPALGLSKPAKQTPLSTHLSALSSHIVYGLATEGASRGLRALLP